ncbi:hypothetical protein M409DRAFT_58141 [Zasmidium cellare ATCC 36951]|uniref:Uncharacterized protein n=1 Tax=Zasmidium cellare ATCC 36951 TaxID=1080233 RepID=A0A6A6C6T5_ZASCE|nr:uncharacterized protein M409DRAFT_58141 [Zasmidium cellare ATCC 36951]KAF2162745.1 hypothetical protein M409DRAFT_58141 [Zasmidium cellare ATCC 36951]
MDVQSEHLPYDRVPEDSPNINHLTDPIPAPSESAHSGEVRSFIVNVLVQQYSIDSEQAQELARLWTVGSGREFRQFPARLFVEIFGLQAGWVLYKEVSARVIEEKVKTMDVFDYRKRAIGDPTHENIEVVFGIWVGLIVGQHVYLAEKCAQTRVEGELSLQTFVGKNGLIDTCYGVVGSMPSILSHAAQTSIASRIFIAPYRLVLAFGTSSSSNIKPHVAVIDLVEQRWTGQP